LNAGFAVGNPKDDDDDDDDDDDKRAKPVVSIAAQLARPTFSRAFLKFSRPPRTRLFE